MSVAEYAKSPSINRFVPEEEQFDARLLTHYLFDRADSAEPAFTFLDFSSSREGEPRTLSWAELANKVSAVATELGQVTSPGQRVAILAPQDLNYVVGFLGALHAGTIAVPLFAPEVSQHGGRLVNALADCAPEVWLTSTDALANVQALAENNPLPMPKNIIAVDQLRAGDTPAVNAQQVAVDIDLDSPAYLQYTSGSTRSPAGAIITHRAVSTNSWQAATGYGVESDWTCVGWVPFFHDMGLIQLLCLPIVAGVHSVFMSPFNFIMKPLRWMKQLSDYPNTFAAAPNFAFEYAASKVKETDRSSLDLSGVKVIINGSEPIRPETIALFNETFGPQGFPHNAHRPSYGLAEATVIVTNAGSEGPRVTRFDRSALSHDRGVTLGSETGPKIESRNDKDAVALVSAGRPWGQLVRIVHPETRIVQADGQVGEIWVYGPNTATGYWEQVERSAETFAGEIADVPENTPADNWLRTGDLGLIADGELYITGRIKDLIIIDGKNHYPQDIEATVQNAHPAIKRDRVAAFAVSFDNESEGAAVVAEHDRKGDPDPDLEAVGKAVRRAVSAQHDIKLRDFTLVAPGAVLRTSSGKIARAATKAKFHAAKADALS